MNLLTSDLPTKIKVKDRVFDINYDYRTAIVTLQACEDRCLSITDKYYIILKNIYKEEIPDEYVEEALIKANKFLDMGMERENIKKEKQRLYSFFKDANYIYSGINSSHNINLQSNPNLHWWVFMSFFLDMGTKCTFNELIYYRKRKAENKLTKEEKKIYKENKELFELTESIEATVSEAKKEFLNEFNS